MAHKRVDEGRGRNPGVVKSSSSATANRSFYLLIGLMAVGGIAALTYAARSKPANVSQIDTTLPAVKSEGYVMGAATAPVEVLEFGDFECPVCATFANLTEPDVRTRLVNTGIIRVRFIDYPLPMHGNTWNASRAAACADEQGKFWEFHDALFQSQDRWARAAGNANPDKFFKDLAKPIVANTDQFNACVDSRKYQAKIQAHEKLATDRKAPGTPTFVIGDKQLGPLTYDQFKAYVDTAVAKAGVNPAAPAAGGDTAKGVALPKKK